MKQDKTAGSLEARKRADLVILDRDILSIGPETIQDTEVLATYLDGRLVYAAEDEGAWWDQREAACVTGYTATSMRRRTLGLTRPSSPRSRPTFS
jgi:hypothetical protein